MPMLKGQHDRYGLMRNHVNKKGNLCIKFSDQSPYSQTLSVFFKTNELHVEAVARSREASSYVYTLENLNLKEGTHYKFGRNGNQSHQMTNYTVMGFGGTDCLLYGYKDTIKSTAEYWNTLYAFKSANHFVAILRNGQYVRANELYYTNVNGVMIVEPEWKKLK